MYVTKGMEESKMCTGAYRGRGVLRLMCMYALTLSFFMFLSYSILFYMQNFNLIFIQKGCIYQKWLVFSNDINFYYNETSFFYFKLFFRTKVTQNAFNFNQIVLCLLYMRHLNMKKLCVAQHGDVVDKVNTLNTSVFAELILYFVIVVVAVT